MSSIIWIQIQGQTEGFGWNVYSPEQVLVHTEHAVTLDNAARQPDHCGIPFRVRLSGRAVCDRPPAGRANGQPAAAVAAYVAEVRAVVAVDDAAVPEPVVSTRPRRRIWVVQVHRREEQVVLLVGGSLVRIDV